jgi:hypothetical protein
MYQSFPHFLPHTVFMCFSRISEQTTIIFLYNIKWLVFIIQKECVYYKVRAEPLNILLSNFNSYIAEEQLAIIIYEKWIMHRDKLRRIQYEPLLLRKPLISMKLS